MEFLRVSVDSVNSEGKRAELKLPSTRNRTGAKTATKTIRKTAVSQKADGCLGVRAWAGAGRSMATPVICPLSGFVAASSRPATPPSLMRGAFLQGNRVKHRLSCSVQVGGHGCRRAVWNAEGAFCTPILNAYGGKGPTSGTSRPRHRQVRKNAYSLVAQVQKQDVAELGSSPSPQGVENVFVLAHGRAQAILVGDRIGRKPRAPKPPRMVRVGRGQSVIAVRRDNALMDQAVDPEIAVQVAAQIERVHRVMESFNFGDFLLGDAFAGEPAGQRLEAAHQVEKVANILLAEATYAGTALPQKLDQSFRSQNLQRFPHRGPRN